MPTFRDSLRALPRPFWVLVGATFVSKFGVFVVPFLTIFMTQKGLPASVAGLAVAAYSTGAFFAACVGGWLADRMGRNMIMGVSALAGAGSMMLLSQANELPWLLSLALLSGFISEAGNPASSALVQDLVPVEHRMAAYAVQRFAVNLGWSMGPVAAGFLAEHSFFWLFAGDAISSAFFGLVAWIFLPRGKGGLSQTSGWSHAWKSIRMNAPFLALFGACITVSFILRQTSTTFTLFFQQSGHPMHLCGAVLAVNGVMICLMELPLTALTRNWPIRGTIALGYVLMALSFLTLVFSVTVTAFTVCIIIFTFGEMMAFSRQQAYAASLAPEDMRGRYSGFLSIAWSTGSIMGSALGMSLYQWNPNAVWYFTAVLGLMGAWLLQRGKD